MGERYKPHQDPPKGGCRFQYPEHQLFEETVWEDVAFGPKNLGLEPSEIKRRVETRAQTGGY